MEVRFLGQPDLPSEASAVDMLAQASSVVDMHLALAEDKLAQASVEDTLDLALAEDMPAQASVEDMLDLASAAGTDQEFDTTLEGVDPTVAQSLVVLHSLGLMVFRNYPFILYIIFINDYYNFLVIITSDINIILTII